LPTDPPPPIGTTLEPQSKISGADPPPPPGTSITPPSAQDHAPGFAPGVPADYRAPGKPSGDYDFTTAVTRSVGKAAIGVIDFIPDMLTYAYNASPLVSAKEKLKLPSSYANKWLDSQLTPPPTKGGAISEDISGAMMGGGAAGAVQLGKAALPLVKRGVQAAVDAAKPLTRVATKAAEEAHVAGIDLPPSYIGGPVRKSMQEMSGGPKLDKEFSKTNAPRVDALAKLSLGLHPSEELSEATFQTLKDEAYKPYEAVRQLGEVPSDGQFIKDVMAAGGRFADREASFGGARFASIAKEKQPYFQEKFDASHALDEIRQLRKLSRDNLKQYNPEANALGMTQREIANALENRIDRHATEIGKADLVEKLRAARTQLAKISAVEDSIGAGGHVRAADFARMLDKNMPLTDSLRTIGETALHFPRAVQELTHGEQGTFSAVDYLLGGSGILSGNPAVAVPVLARPLSRWALKTEGAQKSMISNLSKTPSKAGQVAGRAAGEVGRTLKAGAGAAGRGGVILGSEGIAEQMNGDDPDLQQLAQ
jgi:hypothetical protein